MSSAISIILTVSLLVLNWCRGCWQSDPGKYGITSSYINLDKNTPGAERCLKAATCDKRSKYRTMNGSCNNLDQPTWGAAGATYLRLLPADYNDGIHEIRKARNGQKLPNTRYLSTNLYPDVYVPDKQNNLALMQWGQSLAHDTTSTPFPTIFRCCPNGQFPDTPLPGCSPLSVPKNDPFYSRFNVTCMTYARINTTSTSQNCALKPNQQFSSMSQWLDLSQLYGTSDEFVKSMRLLQGGRLKSDVVNGEEFTHITHQRQNFCWTSPTKHDCFNAGDIQANQNPGIALLTVVLLREHNRLAEGLAKVNPGWDDERLFQEARRLSIAQALHITYSEYLEHVLAPEYIRGMKLASLESGFTKYDSKVRGGTINEFAGSIFRTFHSTLQGDYKLDYGSRGRCPMKSARVADNWWSSADVVITCFEQLAKGLMTQEARLYHNFFSTQVTDMFQRGNRSYGDDMEAVDIMRGRDLGFPTYNKYRQVCGLPTFSSFEQLQTAMEPQMADKLRKLYGDINDIDLYVGAILENPSAPGLPGPTTQCVLAQQFARWKYGDRFFFEHQNETGSFTSEQLKAIRTTTFSSMMCRNTKIDQIQRKGFYQISSTNKLVPCKQIPQIDLTAWKE